jgi:hypothetical protein
MKLKIFLITMLAIASSSFAESKAPPKKRVPQNAVDAYSELCLKFSLPSKLLTKSFDGKTSWKSLTLIPAQANSNSGRAHDLRSEDQKGTTTNDFYVCTGDLQTARSLKCFVEDGSGEFEIKRDDDPVKPFLISFDAVYPELDNESKTAVLKRTDGKTLTLRGQSVTCPQIEY